MKILLASVNLNVQKRCLSQTVSVAKQLPKTDPRNDSAWRHPRKYTIRRNRPYQHRPDYQKTELEVLWDQVTQPHFPSRWIQKIKGTFVSEFLDTLLQITNMKLWAIYSRGGWKEMLKWEMIEMQQKYMVLILLNTKNVKKLSKKRKLRFYDYFPRERPFFTGMFLNIPSTDSPVLTFF